MRFDEFSFCKEDILKELGKLGIDSILLEGGSGLISAAFKENIVDAGEIFIVPKIIIRLIFCYELTLLFRLPLRDRKSVV